MRTLLINGLALLLASPALVHAQTRELSGSGELLDRVVAVVDNGVVLKSEVDAMIRNIQERYRAEGGKVPTDSQLRTPVLEQLINVEVQMQHAEKRGMRIPDEALNEMMRAMAENNKIPFDQLPARMREQGIDYVEFRDNERKKYISEQLIRYEVYPRLRVTPREIDQYLARMNSSMANEDLDISFILLSVPEAATPEQAAAVETRAKDIRERAVKGEDFAQLAIAHSNSSNALEGGGLGWRKGPDLPDGFADAVKGLKPGEVSQPVRRPSGFYLIRLNDRRGVQGQVMANQVHARHILIKTNELQNNEVVKQKITAIHQRLLKGEDFAELARSTSEDTSAAQGGDLGWADESGAYVAEFSKALSMLADNEISAPFQSEHGWHIAQLLGRRVEDVTQEKLRNDAANALAKARLEDETDLWIRRLKDEAFIEKKI